MSRNTTHKSADVEYNGKLLCTFSARITATAATVKFGHFVAPCDGTIVQASINTPTAPTHATSDISFGTNAAPTGHMPTTDWQNHATGPADVLASFTGSVSITKDEVYCWQFAGGDTTGELVTSLVIEPR